MFDFLTGKQVIFLLLAVAALTGLVLIFYLIYFAFFRLKFREHALGEITDIDSKMTRFFFRDVLRQRLRVRFETESGVTEGTVLKLGSFFVGQQVSVRYHTDKPALFFVEENDKLFYAAKVLGVLLVIELVMAALVAVVSRNLGG